MRIVKIMQIDRRVNMARDHLHPIPNPQLRRPLLPAQQALLVAQIPMHVPRVPALRQPAVRRQRLQPRVDRHLALALLADDGREQRQAVGVGGADGVAVVRVHEDEGPRLQLRDAGDGGAGLGRAGAAGGHDVDGEALGSQRGGRVGEDLHRLQALGLAVFVAPDVLHVAFVALQADQTQVLQALDMVGEIESRPAGFDARPVQADVEIDQDGNRFLDTRARERSVDSRGADVAVDDDSDPAMVPEKLHEPLDLQLADDGRGDEDVVEPRTGDDFGFGDLRDAAAFCSRGFEFAREGDALGSFQVRADVAAGGEQGVEESFDVGFHEVEVDDHGGRVET